MTGDELEARVCRSKRAYVDPADARKVRRRMLRQGSTGETMTAYRCPFCRRFHLGRPPSMETLEAIARRIRGLPSADS